MKQQSDKEKLDNINDASTGADMEENQKTTEDINIVKDSGDNIFVEDESLKSEMPEEDFLTTLFDKVWGFIQSFISPTLDKSKYKGEVGSAFDVFNGDGGQFKPIEEGTDDLDTSNTDDSVLDDMHPNETEDDLNNADDSDLDDMGPSDTEDDMDPSAIEDVEKIDLSSGSSSDQSPSL